MKIGVGMGVSPRNWVEFTTAAEAAGFESVWFPEHLIMPVKMSGKPGSPHEGQPPIAADTPAWDPFVVIGFLAGQTSSLRFGTNVYNIGLRHPFVTARALTTLDLVSRGRIDFGIGSSWLAEEWQAMELSFEGRGRRVDETVHVIKRLFTEEVIEHAGEHFRFQPVKFEPKPVQKPWPPLLIGGDAPPAIRRAALIGDGWLPMGQTFETLPANLRRIETLRAEAGRSGPFQVTIAAGGRKSPDDLKRWRDLGVDRVILTPWDHPREALDAMRRFADEVMPALD